MIQYVKYWNFNKKRYIMQQKIQKYSKFEINFLKYKERA